MGLGGVSFWQLLIVFVIVILIFGTSKLKSIGGDLGGAIKGFRKAMENEDEKPSSGSHDEAKKIGSEGKPDAEFSEHSEQSEKEKHG
jgi:sec-independent protein translocase protein TatA